MGERSHVDLDVRTFVENDRAELRSLFGRAGEGSATASIWAHEEAEADVYLTPYIELEPKSLFIAVVAGEMVGYLTGCVDSSEFPSEDDRMSRAIRQHRLMLRRGPMVFFARALGDTARGAITRQSTAGELDDARWPAHLHINVVPQVRGSGVAPALMEHWLALLRAIGSPGCYLQTLVENERAIRFFERAGFERHGPTPIVPGLREHGRRLHQQTMVWSP